jgi:hypothetical protein
MESEKLSKLNERIDAIDSHKLEKCLQNFDGVCTKPLLAINQHWFLR